MRRKKLDKRIISEMGLGMGSMASGMGEFSEAEDDFGGPDMDMDDAIGGVGEDDDLDDMDDMDDMGDDDDETVTCKKSELRDALERLEQGECTVDECMEELCAAGALDADEEDGLDLGDDMDDDMDMDMGGPDLDDDPFDECMESVKRIAGMLTDDPDILAEEEEEDVMKAEKFEVHDVPKHKRSDFKAPKKRKTAAAKMRGKKTAKKHQDRWK